MRSRSTKSHGRSGSPTLVSIAWQITASIGQKAQIKHCPASWDREFPGRLASGRDSRRWSPLLWCIAEGHYDFLLVCYHRFEVASHTPKLLGCKSTLKEWSRWYERSGTAPVEPRAERVPYELLGNPFRQALPRRASGPCRV